MWFVLVIECDYIGRAAMYRNRDINGSRGTCGTVCVASFLQTMRTTRIERAGGDISSKLRLDGIEGHF